MGARLPSCSAPQRSIRPNDPAYISAWSHTELFRSRDTATSARTRYHSG